MVNLSAFLRFHAERTPDRAAIIYEDEPISYRTLAARAAAVAGFLRELGIGEDDVVALFMKNSAAFVELAFAISHLGAVLLPINYRLAVDEVRYITEHAGARLLLLDEEFDEMARITDATVAIDAGAQRDSSRLVAPGVESPPPCPRRPDDLCRLMYTSGTTDHPKGVTISYGNFYWKSMDHVVALGLSHASRLLTVGPLYHVGALDLPGLAVLWMGGTMCLHRDFDTGAALASIERHRLTCGWMAPVMTNAIIGSQAAAGYDLTSFEWLIGGGERTPEQRIREFADVFPGARYIDAYGMTETVSGDTMMEAGREIEKIGSTGRALAHVEVAIIDDEGSVLPAGTDGEIAIRGPKVTRGYWRDPEKSAAAFHRDWLRSGDVGHLDEDGFLYLTDRKKDVIISGGENIASSEVERVIYELPGVSEVAVVGTPDPRWGERPVAVVVLKRGERLDQETLETHCRRRLAGFKIPKALVVRDTLPRNPSGKVLKRVLRDELA